MSLGFQDRKLLRTILSIATQTSLEVIIIKRELTKMSKEQDDLNAATLALTQAVGATVGEIQELAAAILAQVQGGGAIDPAAVETSATTINQMASSLNDAVATAKAALEKASAPPASAPASAPAAPSTDTKSDQSA
jgi:hypothetical protein